VTAPRLPNPAVRKVAVRCHDCPKHREPGSSYCKACSARKKREYRERRRAGARS
jgi:hypothetical protein